MARPWRARVNLEWSRNRLDCLAGTSPVRVRSFDVLAVRGELAFTDVRVIGWLPEAWMPKGRGIPGPGLERAQPVTKLHEWLRSHLDHAFAMEIRQDPEAMKAENLRVYVKGDADAAWLFGVSEETVVERIREEGAARARVAFSFAADTGTEFLTRGDASLFASAREHPFFLRLYATGDASSGPHGLKIAADPSRAFLARPERTWGSATGAGAEEGAEHAYEILLVEDHRALGDVTREMLQHAGQNVTLARSGEEALRLAAVRRPELVLCDLRLPDMDGSELAKRIAKLCGNGVILVAVSAHGAETLEQLDAGLFAFTCSKPLDWNDVVARLSALGH